MAESPLEQVDLGRAGPRPRAAVARLLARAFSETPLARAVVPGPPRPRLRSTWLGLRTAMAGRRPGALWVAGRRSGRWQGALQAVAPGCFPLPPPPLPAQLFCVAGQGLAVARRWARVYSELLAVHPEEPHWYLASLGVDPPAQGAGVGSLLLAGLLERADAEGLPVYLETDREENLVFYARAGFEAAREVRLFGVPVWCLWRAGPKGRTGPAPGPGSLRDPREEPGQDSKQDSKQD